MIQLKLFDTRPSRFVKTDRRPMSAAERKRICELHQDERNPYQIARMVGFSRAAVRMVLAKEGLL